MGKRRQTGNAGRAIVADATRAARTQQGRRSSADRGIGAIVAAILVGAALIAGTLLGIYLHARDEFRAEIEHFLAVPRPTERISP